MLRQSIIKNLSGKINYSVNGKSYSLDLNKKLSGQNEHLNFDIKIFNAFDHAIVQSQVKCLEKIKLKEIVLSSKFKYYDNDRIFCNGYQSWSDSNLAYIKDKSSSLNFLAKPFLKFSGDYSFYSPHTSLLPSWTYSYIQSDNQVVMFAASLGEKNGFTLIEHKTSSKEIFFRKDVKNLEIEGTWPAFEILLFDGKRMDAFQFWFDKMKIPAQSKELKTGWTSWYRHKNKINEELIRNNLKQYSKAKVPLDYFQIDDGWQEAIGDWNANKKKFPNGLSELSNVVSEAGYNPGIWIAPFICERDSTIYKSKKNWIAKRNGKIIKVGYSPIWSGWFYLLDINNTEVRQYIEERIKALKESGFRIFKLDFLYALGLSEVVSKSRYEKIMRGVQWIKEILEDCETIFCGIPISSGFENTEYLRIGPDTHQSYDYKWLARFNFKERPSYVNALKNTILRAELNNYGFSNDPDVCYLSTENTDLNEKQVLSKFYLNYILGGLQFISDNWQDVPKNMQEIFLSMFPIKKCTITAIDRQKEAYFLDFKIDDQNYNFIINLGHKNIEVQLKSYGFFYDIISKEFLNGNTNISLEIGESICAIKCSNADLSYLRDGHHLLPFAI